MTETIAKKIHLGQLLQARGIVTDEQIREVLAQQKQSGHRKLLGELLVQAGYCTENQIASAIAEDYSLPYAEVNPKICDVKVIELLPRGFLEEHTALPLFKVYNILTVAISEPSNVFLIDELERISGCKVQIVCATAKDIKTTLQAQLPAEKIFVIEDIINEEGLEDFSLVDDIIEDISDLEEIAGQSPVVKLVNYIIYNAVHENASDIHIEPDEKKLRIRYRVDGKLFERLSPPYKMHSAVISRIKIMAGLDIAQRRLPQDGGINILIEGKPIDLRVSVMSGTYGEKIVVRVVNPEKVLFNLESLGFSQDTLKLYEDIMETPHGMILVTGPTGSGKSATLYATLTKLNNDDINICSVEDPVECKILGVNQFQMNEAAGFSFPSALRSLLRQDPDIIMVGEIRDEETAYIAVQAALTGHLLFATLHTNDAPSSVTRLLDLNVAPYLVSASLTAVLAQRLVRKICVSCKTEYQPPVSIQKTVERLMGKVPKFYHGVGCRKCRNTGFAGRIALQELFIPDEDTMELIYHHTSLRKLRAKAIENGMIPLHLDGLQKVKAGIVTIEEVLRTVPTDEDSSNK